MTGRNCLWLDLNFVTLYVLLAIMTLMAGYGGAVIWQNDCTCLTVSFDSVKSQSMKRWLALSRFWSEIDWQFSDPRIVTALGTIGMRECDGWIRLVFLTGWAAIINIMLVVSMARRFCLTDCVMKRRAYSLCEDPSSWHTISCWPCEEGPFILR